MKHLAEKAAQMRTRAPEPPAKVIVLQPPAPRVAISRPIKSTVPLQAVRGYLEWLWSFRRCGICGNFGPCADREPDVDIAQAEGWFEYLKGLTR